MHTQLLYYLLQYVNQGHLEITVLRTATVSVNANVIKQMVYVLLVDVNVDTKGLPVVQVFDTDDLFYIYKKKCTLPISINSCYNRI